MKKSILYYRESILNRFRINSESHIFGNRLSPNSPVSLSLSLTLAWLFNRRRRRSKSLPSTRGDFSRYLRRLLRAIKLEASPGWIPWLALSIMIRLQWNMEKLMFVYINFHDPLAVTWLSCWKGNVEVQNLARTHSIFTTFNNLLSNPKMTAPSRRLLLPPPPKSEPLSRFNFRRQLFPPL